jgi:hypothetical protein
MYMSYICLLANEAGISVAGDSRITLQPVGLGLHISGKKVFSDEKQQLVWGCCGLVAFGGVHYPTVAAQLLRDPNPSLATALERIAGLTSAATKANRRLYGQDSTFTLLVGRIWEGQVDVRSLTVCNGEVRIRRYDTPVQLEAGWYPSRYPRRLPSEQVAEATVEKLNRMAVERVRAVIAADSRLHQEDGAWKQTVGGNVRAAFVERR